MQTLEESTLDQINAGGDTFGKDIGQFLGGVGGWIRANPGAYFVLGPGVGGFAAMIAGVYEAAR